MNSGENFIYINNNFVDRQKHLNEQLGIAEKSLNKHNNHKDSHVPRLEELSIKSHKKIKIKGFRGRQSLFKRPEGPAPRSKFRIIPDYRKNPTKWTCYSLDNVSDISNETNSETAFLFLNELRQRKQHELKKQYKFKEKLNVRSQNLTHDLDNNTPDNKSIEIEARSISDNEHKNTISFRKPQIKKESCKEDDKPEFRHNKIIMPEYLVGTKKISKKKQTNIKLQKVLKNNEMRLDHLQMYDDEV
ncbi:PREDICTED: uncharacterized protein LOC105364724 [Ceratosolen solmsi marchali]|uniref:U5 small nuclear ribonucleoprotein TSSC4 n=1 Tax=Ceratosolen solmsi marchali TaxID=326594 RepID=A0AAJ6YMW6_9HYME|nr:PREDICTED: uncharacterized protein LOC105364724 [Ceratosolen solmsi marchali]